MMKEERAHSNAIARDGAHIVRALRQGASSAAPRGFVRERLASGLTLERVALLINMPWQSELRRLDLRYHREHPG
jgi:hypothetical protein